MWRCCSPSPAASPTSAASRSVRPSLPRRSHRPPALPADRATPHAWAAQEGPRHLQVLSPASGTSSHRRYPAAPGGCHHSGACRNPGVKRDDFIVALRGISLITDDTSWGEGNPKRSAFMRDSSARRPPTHFTTQRSVCPNDVMGPALARPSRSNSGGVWGLPRLYLPRLSSGIMMWAYGVLGHMIHGPPFRWSVEILSNIPLSGTSIIKCGPTSVTQSSGPVASIA